MNKKNKQEEIQSRREFFKKAAKTALPVLGAVVLSSIPFTETKADYVNRFTGECTGCSGSCQRSCSGTCSGSCEGGCQGSCVQGCQGNCKGDCYGTCKGSCGYSSYN